MPFHGWAIKLAHVEEALEGLGRQCANQTDPQPTAIRTELESKPQRTDACKSPGHVPGTNRKRDGPAHMTS